MSIKERLNENVRALRPSLLWQFFAMAMDTPNVISLSVGEPDFPTPWHISEEGIYAIERERTYYPPSLGFTQLRRGIAAYYERRFGAEGYTADNVMVTVGASEGIDLACRSFLQKGDECIILDPGYVAYEPSVILTGATPVYLQLEEKDGFKVKAESLRKVLNEKTKMIILNYPSNPTGGIMTKEDYEELVPLLKQYNVIVVADEIYLELVYGQKPFSIACIEELRDQLIIVSGFSKAWSMTGWRLGYMLADPELILTMNNIHQYSTVGPATPAQFAAIEAVSPKSDRDIDTHVQSFESRRNYLTAQLNRMGLHTPLPEGAFYVFANITSTGLSSYDFCVRLLQEQAICVIPGTAFGASGEEFVRISYAYSLQELKTACARIEQFLESLK